MTIFLIMFGLFSTFMILGLFLGLAQIVIFGHYFDNL